MSEHTPAPTPNRAVYGFIFSLVFKILFIIYLIWALCPKKWLIALDITCLPNQYWSVVMPIFLLTILATFAFVIYPSMGFLMTPKWNDIRTIKDKWNGIQNVQKSNSVFLKERDVISSREMCYCQTGKKCKKSLFSTADVNEYHNRKIPKLEDLNIIDVSKHMYLQSK